MKRENKQQTGKVNYVWALAGGYLIYLGGKLLYGFYRDPASGSSPILVLGASLLFIAVGALLLRREWKAYKFGMEHKDDPSTWNDELAEEARRAEEAAEQLSAGTGECECSTDDEETRL